MVEVQRYESMLGSGGLAPEPVMVEASDGEWVSYSDLAAERAEVRRLRQGIWDMATQAGMDTDGDTTPDAVRGDIVELGLEEVRELRESYREAGCEAAAERERSRKLREALKELVEACDSWALVVDRPGLGKDIEDFASAARTTLAETSETEGAG